MRRIWGTLSSIEARERERGQERLGIFIQIETERLSNQTGQFPRDFMGLKLSQGLML